MSTEIIKILDAICEKFGIAIDWTSQNVMPYVEQIGKHIVQYELWTSSLWTILALIVLIAGTIVCCKKIKNAYGYEYEGREEIILAVGAILFVIYIIFAPLLIVQIQDVITSFTFPEKTILDFITTYTQNQ